MGVQMYAYNFPQRIALTLLLTQPETWLAVPSIQSIIAMSQSSTIPTTHIHGNEAMPGSMKDVKKAYVKIRAMTYVNKKKYDNDLNTLE